MRHDVVYILKNDYDSEEVRYSIRSVCMNFPFRKIVFVGGAPADIYPEIYIEDIQEGDRKWNRSLHSLKKVCECEDLTEDIWLFNDDFFVMDKVRQDVNYFNGSLEKRVIDLRRKNPRGSGYINQLESLRYKLIRMNKDALSFALHVPMLINRHNALEILKKNISPMFRSLYGNYYSIDCQFMEDVKIYDLETVPDTSFISTTDESFRDGKVGEFLRAYFSEACTYEKSAAERLRDNTKEIFNEEGEIRNE